MPTRERLAKAQAFLKTVVETAENLKQIEVIVAIDDDDIKSQSLSSPHPDLTLFQVKGPQDTMGTLNTRCLQKATGDILMLVNDDILIRSKRWDRLFIETAARFPDGIILIHTRDGYKDRSFPLFPILTKKGSQLLKDPYPKNYCGDCIDSHLFDIFLRLKDLGYDRIVYLPDVFFEHMHFSVGKAPIDPLYQKRSRIKSNQTFYSLWKQREQSALTLFQAIEGKKNSLLLPPIRIQNSYYLLIKSFFKSHQTLSFRLRYLIYHLLRETYLRFHLEKVKVRFNQIITFLQKSKKRI